MSTSRRSPIEDLDERATLRARVVELERENNLLKQVQRAPPEADGGLQTSGIDGMPALASLKQIYGEAPIGLCYLDTNLRFVFINEWMAAINGLSVEEHLGRSISEILPDVAAGVDAQLRQVLETGEPIVEGTVEAETAAQSGVKRHFRHNYDAVRSADGDIIGVSCVVQDITERKRAEAALRLIVDGTSRAFGEDFFRSLTGHLALALEVRTAFVSELLEGSEARLRLLACWDGNDFGENFEYDVEGTPCEQVIEQGVAYYPANVQQLFPDDRWLKESRIESYLAVPLLNSEGNCVGHLGVADDKAMPKSLLAESILRIFAARAGAELLRKRAEALLRHTQFAVEHSSEGIYWVRPDGQITYANRAACRALGYSYDELVSMSVPDINPDVPHEAWRAQFEKMKKAGSMTFEAHDRTKEGRIVPVEILANYLEYEGEEYICAFVRDITERKQAEDSLREREELYRSAIAAADAVVYQKEYAGNSYTHMNAAITDLIGYDVDEVTADLWLKIITQVEMHGPLRGKSQSELRQLFMNGELPVWQGDYKCTTKNGETRWLNDSSVPIHDRAGKVVGCLGVLQNITDRKLAEQDSHDKQVQLDNLLSNVDAIILEGDPFDIYYVGGQVEKILGYSKEMWFEHPEGPVGFWSELLHPDDEDSIELCRQAIERGEDHCFEYRLIAKNGKPIWFYDSVMVECFEGKPVKTRSVMIDITERKRAEEALRESESKYRELFESASDVVCLLDSEGNIVDINRRGELLTGYSRAELRRMNVVRQLIVPEDHVVYKHVIERAAPEAQHVYEVRWRTKQGKIVHFEGASTYRFSASGEFMTTRCTLRDITERKRAEEHARQLQADLAHMSRLSSMGEMAAGLAHELNQPLTVITNYAQGCVRRLKSNAISEDELENVLSRIATQAQRSSSIIRGLGNLVRKSSARRTDIDVNQSIIEVTELANAEAAQHRVKARFELERNLPCVLANQTQLQQVILNLVQNGCEAIEDASVSRRAVTVRTKQRGDRELEIAVSDNGRGISEPLGERLFEPFFTTKADGIGMGLAISRSIVESHGGRLWATPNQGGGTTFHFTLPIVGGGDGDEQ